MQNYIFVDLAFLSISFFWLRVWGNNLLILEYEGIVIFQNSPVFIYCSHRWSKKLARMAQPPLSCQGWWACRVLERIWPSQSTFICFNIIVYSSSNKMSHTIATLHLPDSYIRPEENYNRPTKLNILQYFCSHRNCWRTTINNFLYWISYL